MTAIVERNQITVGKIILHCYDTDSDTHIQLYSDYAYPVGTKIQWEHSNSDKPIIKKI